MIIDNDNELHDWLSAWQLAAASQTDGRVRNSLFAHSKQWWTVCIENVNSFFAQVKHESLVIASTALFNVDERF